MAWTGMRPDRSMCQYRICICGMYLWVSKNEFMPSPHLFVYHVITLRGQRKMITLLGIIRRKYLANLTHNCYRQTILVRLKNSVGNTSRSPQRPQRSSAPISIPESHLIPTHNSAATKDFCDETEFPGNPLRFCFSCSRSGLLMNSTFCPHHAKGCKAHSRILDSGEDGGERINIRTDIYLLDILDDSSARFQIRAVAASEGINPSWFTFLRLLVSIQIRTTDAQRLWVQRAAGWAPLGGFMPCTPIR